MTAGVASPIQNSDIYLQIIYNHDISLLLLLFMNVETSSSATEWAEEATSGGTCWATESARTWRTSCSETRRQPSCDERRGTVASDAGTRKADGQAGKQVVKAVTLMYWMYLFYVCLKLVKMFFFSLTLNKMSQKRMLEERLSRRRQEQMRKLEKTQAKENKVCKKHCFVIF